ncbi:MAG: hypothetical protein IJW08_09210 [Lentisphaeria bacterium]|nr:hypothetical protein [Lentisphaeria bacterium]
MRYLKVISLFFLLGAASVILPADSGVLAEVDGRELHSNELCKEAAALLPDAALPEDVRSVKIQAAVQLEVKIRTTEKLLSQAGIKADRSTAEWYISERCAKYGMSGDILRQGLEKLINDRGFQLKSAIYRYIQSTQPEKTVISKEEAESHYRRNQMSFRKSVPGTFLVASVPQELPEAKERISSLRAALMQGENISTAAERHKIICRPAPPEFAAGIPHKNLKLYRNWVSAPFVHEKNLCIAVCVEPPSKEFIPFEKICPLIEEELISRRTGAAFDIILKKQLSLIKIKYRR